MITFDQKVWDAVSRVPRGKVTTYGSLARAIGIPKAARAVGRALNKNPHAPRVPCHRVIQSNGRLGGYAGGIGKKIVLLRREGIRIMNDRISADQIFFFK